MSRLVEYFRLRPDESFTTGWLEVETQTPRQAVSVALEALRAVGVLEQGYDDEKQLTTWRWVGYPGGPEPAPREDPRARPRVRPPASGDEAEYRNQVQRDGWYDEF